MSVKPARRVTAAAVAAGLGVLLLLSPAGVTTALWYEQAILPDTQISTGALRLTAGSTAPVQLHSRFTAEQRTFTGGTTCSAPEGFAACREFTADQLAQQPLLPGDQVVLSEKFTAVAEGTNLIATLSLNHQELSTALPQGSRVETEVLRHGQTVKTPATITGKDSPQDWEVRSTITTPAQWPPAFQNRSLQLGGLTVLLEQQPPQ